MSDADRVFVSHGHQDHLRDVPAIVAVSGAMVYCSAVAARTLKRKGVPRDRVRLLADGESLGFDGCGVRVAECEHSKTDLELMLRTAPRLLRLVPRLLVETVTMSSGPLLVFTFDLGGLSIMHMGSLCRSVSRLSEGVGGHDRPAPPDILLIPLRGRSDIGRLAAEAAAAIKPRAVVPQHHDNFLPPLSPPVDVESFRSLLAGMMPGCIYYEPTMNLEFDESDVFGAR
jgi:L-ascorbate metabolism protein UlaG (beta-lactamase superfamily)